MAIKENHPCLQLWELSNCTVSEDHILNCSIVSLLVNGKSTKESLPSNADKQVQAIMKSIIEKIVIKSKMLVSIESAASIANVNSLPCQGISSGNYGEILSYVVRAMKETGERLLQMSREEDSGIDSFEQSLLLRSTDLILPYGDMILRKSNAGYTIFSKSCLGVSVADQRAKVARCIAYLDLERNRLVESLFPLHTNQLSGLLDHQQRLASLQKILGLLLLLSKNCANLLP